MELTTPVEIVLLAGLLFAICFIAIVQILAQARGRQKTYSLLLAEASPTEDAVTKAYVDSLQEPTNASEGATKIGFDGWSSVDEWNARQ